MTGRRMVWFVTVTVLTLIASLSAPALPFESQGGTGTEAGQDAAVDEMLRQQQAIVPVRPFSYDPEGRRDPFRSLRAPNRGSDKPEGVGGLSVEELDLVGIAKHPDGDVALVVGPDSKGYFLRAGDSIFNGTVIAVDSRHGKVTFRQQVDSEDRIKPYRDVDKLLVPQDEELGDG